MYLPRSSPDEMWSILPLGGRLRTVLVALVAVGVLGGAFAAGLIGAPAVAGVENAFGPVDENTTVVETDITVSNPNPIGVSLGGVTVDYDVLLNDVSLANGSKEGVAVETGNSTLHVTTAADNDRIPPWWISHVRNDERTTVTVDTSVTSGTLGRTVDPPNVTRQIETDLLSQFNSTETRPINADQPLVSDPVLYVNETSAEWGEVTDSRTAMDLTFVVYNPKPYPIGVSELGYDVTMNDVAVGEGSTDSEYVVPPKSTESVEATVYIRNDRIDEWWVTHLERNQVTELRIDFDARLDLAETTVSVPLDPLTYTETIETDIFGTKPTDPGGDSTAENDGSTTQTETPSDTETRTETTSTDDDGILGDGAETTSAPTPTETATPTETTTATTETATPAETPTTPAETATTTDDDGGLLG
ncbi:LEA type 2 family protein [Halobellus litoreus]|uniref:LEA type 2 family protein n=1 Tax=Halobellus litoreus TaxID=755310 RepID=A0ABD6DR70_9EURY|nr:LEA type 2 family protein [Halobellus litoreus]